MFTKWATVHSTWLSAGRPFIHNKRYFSDLSRLFSRRVSSPFINVTKRTVSHIKNPSPLFRTRKLLCISLGLAGGGLCLGVAAAFSLSRWPSLAHCESPPPLVSPAASLSTEVTSADNVNWRIFFSFVWPELGYFLAAVASALVVAVLNIRIPLQLGELINALSLLGSQINSGEVNASMQTFIEGLQVPLLRLVSSYVLQGFFTFSYISLLSCMGENVAANMRKMMFASLLAEDVEFYDRHRCGDLLSHLSSDVQDFKSSFKLCVSQGLRSGTQIVGSAGALLYLSYEMTGLMFLMIPALVAIGSVAGSHLRKRSRHAQAQNSIANNVAEEALGNMRTVKSFAMEESEFGIYCCEVEKANSELKSLGVRIGLFQGVSNIGLNGLILATLSCGGYLVVSQRLNEGDLMAFLVASQTIQRSLAQISQLFGQVVRGYAALQRVLEFIPVEYNSANLRRLLLGEEASSVLLRLSDGEMRHREIQLEFRNVNFAYPTRPEQVVLENFNLRLPPGKVVALCGKSGSGKSTIVSLLERFYEPSGGAILLNGRPLNQYSQKWLRQRLLGLISQEPQLFNVSVRENIRFGRPEATDAEVEEAARAANAAEFIESAFPEGYDTVVGERGATVSGGQKQRIAIARALLKDPAVLILDEATSALDNASESIVQRTLQEVMKDRTVLVIAHRLSTIQHADLIVVLHQGRIVEQGTHLDLMKAKGHYWRLLQKNAFRE